MNDAVLGPGELERAPHERAAGLDRDRLQDILRPSRLAQVVKVRRRLRSHRVSGGAHKLGALHAPLGHPALHRRPA